MAIRNRLKIGDIFFIKVDMYNKRYFQYVHTDLSQHKSKIIRAFKSLYPMEAYPSAATIVSDEVAFYAHTNVTEGLNLELWHKYDNSTLVDLEALQKITFFEYNRCMASSLRKHDGNSINYNWKLWSVNGNICNIPDISNYSNSNLEIGSIMPVVQIKFRLINGYYTFCKEEYDIIKRKPFSYISTFIRREIYGIITYLYFKGENVFEVLCIDNNILLKDNPSFITENTINEIKNLKFGDINWNIDNYINRGVFENVKESKCKYQITV